MLLDRGRRGLSNGMLLDRGRRGISNGMLLDRGGSRQFQLTEDLC
jgi:hypothetical protein